MDEYFEEQLNTTKSRITELEKDIIVLQENLLTVTDQLKETQRFLIKLVHNQSEIARRVSSWPFLTVNERDGD